MSPRWVARILLGRHVAEFSTSGQGSLCQSPPPHCPRALSVLPSGSRRASGPPRRARRAEQCAPVRSPGPRADGPIPAAARRSGRRCPEGVTLSTISSCARSGPPSLEAHGAEVPDLGRLSRLAEPRPRRPRPRPLQDPVGMPGRAVSRSGIPVAASQSLTSPVQSPPVDQVLAVGRVGERVDLSRRARERCALDLATAPGADQQGRLAVELGGGEGLAVELGESSGSRRDDP